MCAGTAKGIECVNKIIKAKKTYLGRLAMKLVKLEVVWNIYTKEHSGMDHKRRAVRDGENGRMTTHIHPNTHGKKVRYCVPFPNR